MKNIISSLCLYFICLTSNAAVLEISSLNVTTGNVLINGSINTQLLPGDDPFIRMGDYQGVFESGNVFGSIVTGGDATGTPFYGITVSYDGNKDYPAPTGTVDSVLGTIRVDLTSWFLWQVSPSVGTLFNEGGIATGTYDAITGQFTMSWDGLIEDGTFPDPNTWTLTGTVNLVPLPAGIWLFLSGLMVFVSPGIIRKYKLS